ncbi:MULTISPECIES: SDR family oxidoreductase [unclassified Rathayibacter]|jgi:NAD(P)-dependent dehydrogenase (short-subunit alcohol dehydrogenase family)|uniref:SDR family oxidoreductase n=2 Tax=Rathayibacter TaxID=33886 RepID=UPI000CE80BF8|nr:MULTISPECIES: SDR family oxidoreductase [unclassified Rathayibacter]PPF28704.1 short-chain dehydrogenase [Rathayibacter sp. AY1F2]PPF58084.1 short-chain dehydrogenase [Rathayibacter sp. AY1C2]PPG17776.1 short-chain dehydrogenase [Rathayibacter sp. AY1C6]PPG52919.1 short-chain dehydrogenase [Rathayibacter sp. AY1E9]PPG59834.1 short-chain dehydrogenase [Rathayibacter sp. AY1C5]
MSTTPTPIGRVLITGGASGLGAAVAAAVAAAGGTPIVLDRDVSSVKEGVAAYQVDVAKTREAEKAVVEIAREHGGLDAVVTAAGIDRCGRLVDVEPEEWERVISVNLLGTAAVVRAALPFLTETHGRVVTVASSLAIKAVSDATAYCASKFGVLGFTRALAAETKGEIGVTTLIPSGMKTRFFDDRDEQYKPGPDALLNDPENVANAVMFVLGQPRGCEVRELVITHEEEPSWP